MDALAKLELYDTLFYVSMGVAILGFVLAVLFFFLFHIPQLFALSTGRAQKKTLEQMRRQGEASGSIRQGKTAAKESRSYAASVVENRGRTEEIAASTSAADGEQQTTLLDADQTTVLETETSVLYREKPDTTVLKGLSPKGRRREPGTTTPLSPDMADNRSFNFKITEEIIFIHTEEMI